MEAEKEEEQEVVITHEFVAGEDLLYAAIRSHRDKTSMTRMRRSSVRTQETEFTRIAGTDGDGRYASDATEDIIGAVIRRRCPGMHS